MLDLVFLVAIECLNVVKSGKKWEFLGGRCREVG